MENSKLKAGDYFYNNLRGIEWKVLSHDEESNKYKCECTKGSGDGAWTVGELYTWEVLTKNGSLIFMWTLGRHPDSVETPDNVEAAEYTPKEGDIVWCQWDSNSTPEKGRIVLGLNGETLILDDQGNGSIFRYCDHVELYTGQDMTKEDKAISILKSLEDRQVIGGMTPTQIADKVKEVIKILQNEGSEN